MGKGQALYPDLLIGVAIFSVVIVLFLALSRDLSPEEFAFKTVVADSEAISSSLMSPGEPSGWNSSKVSKLGIVDDSYRLNEGKVALLMNFSPVNASYLFGTSSKYAVFFRDRHGNVQNIYGCVHSNAGLVVNNITTSLCENFTITPKAHLVTLERLVLYNAQIIKIVVQTWV